MDEEQRAIVLHARDNVATALMGLEEGSTLSLKVSDRVMAVTLTKAVPFGHKFSLAEIERGGQVIKYGEVIGIATNAIHPGDYVHIHNVASSRGGGQGTGGEV